MVETSRDLCGRGFESPAKAIIRAAFVFSKGFCGYLADFSLSFFMLHFGRFTVVFLLLHNKKSFCLGLSSRNP